MRTPMKIVEALINQTGSITYETYCNICEVAKDVSTDDAVKSVNSAFENIIGRVKAAYTAVKELPTIRDTVSVKALQGSTTGVRNYVNRFKSEIDNFVTEYKQLRSAVTESVVESAIGPFIESADDNESEDTKKSTDKEELGSIKDVADASVRATHVALQGIDNAYNQFMNAVRKKDSDVDQEAKVLKKQCDLFLKEYDKMSSNFIHNFTDYVSTGLSFCVATGSVVMKTTMSAVGRAIAPTAVKMANSEKMDAIEKALNSRNVKRFKKELSKQGKQMSNAIKKQSASMKKSAKKLGIDI